MLEIKVRFLLFHPQKFLFSFFVFFLDFTYLFEREIVYKWKGEAEREGEADSLLSREPDAELDPRTPGS